MASRIIFSLLLPGSASRYAVSGPRADTTWDGLIHDVHFNLLALPGFNFKWCHHGGKNQRLNTTDCPGKVREISAFAAIARVGLAITCTPEHVPVPKQE